MQADYFSCQTLALNIAKQYLRDNANLLHKSLEETSKGEDIKLTADILKYSQSNRLVENSGLENNKLNHNKGNQTLEEYRENYARKINGETYGNLKLETKRHKIKLLNSIHKFYKSDKLKNYSKLERINFLNILNKDDTKPKSFEDAKKSSYLKEILQKGFLDLVSSGGVSQNTVDKLQSKEADLSKIFPNSSRIAKLKELCSEEEMNDFKKKILKVATEKKSSNYIN